MLIILYNIMNIDIRLLTYKIKILVITSIAVTNFSWCV